MAYTTINDPSAHFNAILYSGNSGNPRSLTGVGFKPDFLWIKRRNASERHLLTNVQMGASSGAYKWLDSGATESEFSGGTGVQSFDSDGFTFKGVDATWNASSNTYVAWNWKANGGTTASNTDGDLTSTVQANTTAGFSIITYTGKSPIEPLDIGHGLGAVPEFWIIKSKQIGGKQWGVYHKDMSSLPQNGYMTLHNHNVYYAASSWWRNEAPTSTVIKTGEQDDVNRANSDYLCYAWTSIQGFSKFGSYIANANATGPFVYTGFKPAWVLRKCITRAEPWMLMDNKRSPINQLGTILDPSSSAGDATTPGDYAIDFLSNGFKLRSGNTSYGNHTGGVKYIYIAFAENPFVTSTGIPATAK